MYILLYIYIYMYFIIYLYIYIYIYIYIFIYIYIYIYGIYGNHRNFRPNLFSSDGNLKVILETTFDICVFQVSC